MTLDATSCTMGQNLIGDVPFFRRFLKALCSVVAGMPFSHEPCCQNRISHFPFWTDVAGGDTQVRLISQTCPYVSCYCHLRRLVARQVLLFQLVVLAVETLGHCLSAWDFVVGFQEGDQFYDSRSVD